MLRILLTGGAGFIGSHTAVALLDRGYDVVLLDNFSNSARDVPLRVEKITGRPCPCVDVDLLDSVRTREVFEAYDIGAVMHFAGLKAVGESVEKPIEYYGNNLSGTIHLIDAMRSAGVKNLIFSSSATVYRSDNPVPYREDFPLGAINPYGWTKVMIEQILSDTGFSDSEWRMAFLRYFNPIGAHESGLIGEEPQGIPNNLLPYVARVAAGELPEIRIFGDDYDTPDGTGVRDYIHVMDLAEGHILAMERIMDDSGNAASPDESADGNGGDVCGTPEKDFHCGDVCGTSEKDFNGGDVCGTQEKDFHGGDVCGTPEKDFHGRVRAWNLGTGKGTSVKEIIAAFEKACGHSLPRSVQPRRAGDLASVYANTDRARQELGFNAKYDIGKMCSDSWRWQMSKQV